MMKIDVGKAFERVDFPPSIQPPDYTFYSSGDVKTSTGVKVTGIISQEGLHKRDADKLKEKVAKNNNQVPTGIDKPVQNVGILSAVDKFFNWLNKMLGE